MDSTAQNDNKQKDLQKESSQPVQSAGGSVHKEIEPLPSISGSALKEVQLESEIPPEVEKAGVTRVAETIEVPPDIKQLGVKASGPTISALPTPPLPNIVLPISDQIVLTGLHSQVANSLKWLAVWCVRRLKRAHVMLKVIHGKIIRVKT